MAQVKLFGYTDKISVRAGETIHCHVSAEGTTTAEAHLVRLIHGDQHPDGPGFIEEEVACDANGTWQVGKQYTQVGSFLEVADPERRLALDGSFTLFAFVYPTWPQSGHRQSLIGRWDINGNLGYGLGINQNGCLELAVGQGGDAEYLQAEVPFQTQMWYLVAASFDVSTGRATLYQEVVGNRYNGLLSKVVPFDYDAHVSRIFRHRPKHSPVTPFLMAGARDRDAQCGDFVSQLYSGKIDRCGVFDRPLQRDELDALKNGEPLASEGLIAHWDTTKGYTDHGIGDIVVDVGPFRLDAVGYNRPVRGQTGWNWDGFTDCFRLAPHEFGGIDFHSDAMVDCNWKATKAVNLPKTMRSGAYAMRLRAGNGGAMSEDHIVFFVRPAVATGRIALLFPTATYLAYANERMSFDDPERQSVVGQPPIVSEADIEMYRGTDFGLSIFDQHADGSGVCYSSYHRPILNMRPKHRIASLNVAWGLSADLSILAWLERQKYDYDVLTDEDLHREGTAALAPYKCVISGTHPEYCSERMLDATEDYVADGGRYIYAGANGFNWSVAFRDSEPWVMECRKRDDGYKTWVARYGEHYMATNGDRGGPWKSLGRPSHKLTGVGFSGQGGGRSEPYRRMPDSYHRMVTWITEGIEGEVIGDSGLADGGAAGLALDCYDLSLGTPPNTKIIASSGGHTDAYVINPELVMYAYVGMTGSFDDRIHADMTYFTAPNKGAVFACGSIAFGQALPVNNFDNNASRILSNIVDAFAKPGTLPGWAWISEEKAWR